MRGYQRDSSAITDGGDPARHDLRDSRADALAERLFARSSCVVAIGDRFISPPGGDEIDLACGIKG